MSELKNLPAIPAGADKIPVNKQEVGNALGMLGLILQKTDAESSDGGTLGDLIKKLISNTKQAMFEPETFQKEFKALGLDNNTNKALTDGTHNETKD